MTYLASVSRNMSWGMMVLQNRSRDTSSKLPVPERSFLLLLYIMSFKSFDSKKAGSRIETNEPRLLSEILSEFFAGDSPLARGYRDRRLFKDVFPTTELDVDLKLLTRQPGRPALGALLDGIIARDGDERYVFVEKAHEKKVTTVRRNPVIFEGGCFNVHRLADGTPRLEVCHPRFYPDFTFRDFCLAGAQELLTIARLIGEADSE